MGDMNVSHKAPATYNPAGEQVTDEGAQPTSSLTVRSADDVSPAAAIHKTGVDAPVTPVGQYSNLTGLAPSPPDSVQGANYKQNLSSAKEKIMAGAAATGALSYAVLKAESGKISRAGQKDQEAIKEVRTEMVSKQANSILDSVNGSPKKHCPTPHAGTKETVGKMKALGFSDSQAKALTRVLQDKRTPESTKARLSFELAAMGMTGRGQENSRIMSTNSEQLKQELGKFADEVGTKPSKKLMLGEGSDGIAGVFNKNVTHTAEMSGAPATPPAWAALVPGGVPADITRLKADMAVDKITNVEAYKLAATAL